MMRIDLTKYQALGNDYLVVDLPAPVEQLVPMLPTLCDRHRGLGADGLLAFDRQRMSVRIFNPDSSEAQKSGNGLRIAAAHAVLEHGEGDIFDDKVMQRAAWDFALVSLAAVRRSDGNVRLVFGGVAPKPWRVSESVEEDVSVGGLSEDDIATLAERALYDARPLAKNGYKVQMAAAVLRRAIARVGAS